MLIILSSLLLLLKFRCTNAGVSNGNPKTWITQCDPSTGDVIELLKLVSTPAPSHEVISKGKQVTISLSTDTMYQRIEGYGAGLPQSSAAVLFKLKQSNITLYNSVLSKLFGQPSEDHNNEMGLNMIRFPIGSCDFSITNTSYDEVKDDFKLNYFNLDSDTQTYIVDILRDVKKVNPQLRLIASPWSAPSWMKVMQTLIGTSNSNTLVDDTSIYQTYANYFVRVLEAFEAEGLHIDYLTLQNEPLFGDSQEYPGMYLSAEQELRLAKILFPNIQGKNVKLLGYDHNWDHPEYPQYLLSDLNTPFSGTAWHCYGGDMVHAQEELHRLFPTKEQHVTECTGSYPNDKCDITQGMTGFGFNHEWDMSNLYLGAAGHWASTGVKWVIALDEFCGPTLPLVSYKNGRPLVAIRSNATTESDIYFNQDFWTIAHMSKFLSRGSYRIGSTVSGESAGSILSESFIDKTAGILTTLLMNSDHTNEIAVTIKIGPQIVHQDSVPPFSTKIYRWKL